MKASAAMRVEIAIAKALSDRILKAATFEGVEADLETLRALHARTPSEALPLALSHLVEFLDNDDPRRSGLVKEGQSALQQARKADQRRSTSEQSRPFVVPPTEYKQVPPRSSALVLDPESGWHLPPAFSGEWTELRSGEAEDAVDRVRSAFPEAWSEEVVMGVRAVRRIPMSCYSGFDVVEVLFQFEDRPRISQLVLLGLKIAVWITGDSGSLHQLNALRDEDGEPHLDISTDDRAAEYLRFFCGAVYAEEGPFRVVASAAELGTHMKPDVDYAVPDDVFAATPMKRVEGETSELAWQTDVTVLYANHLFRAKFQIQRSGMVVMAEDEPLVPDLPAVRQAMGRGLRQIRGSV